MSAASKVLHVSNTEAEADVELRKMSQGDVDRSSEKAPEAGLGWDTNDYQSAIDMDTLGLSHLEHFRDTGTLSDLEEAVRYFTRALTLTPDGHPDMSLRHGNLGVSYNDRYQRLGNVTDLERAIECTTRALALTPEGHPDMPGWHASLGVSYGDRYRRLGQLTDLEKAIECGTSALALTPDRHPDMSGRHTDLGVCYTLRYQRLSDVADLEKAMKCHTRALELTPDDHPDISLRHAELGVLYGDRYRCLGRLADLEEAMKCYNRALDLTPDGHPDMSYRHANLGVSYTDRYRRLGELADLEKAMEFYNRALELTPVGHPDMSARQADLGVSYTDRYQRLSDPEDLEKAIECYTRALELTPDDHPDMSDQHNNLGISYTDRYRRLGELADLEKAMECYTRALALTPDGHPDMSLRHGNLGACYTDRYQRLGELSDLEKAIACHSRALALTPDGHPDISSRHTSLGVSYNGRFERLGKLEDLEKAIECYTHALALTPDGHPDMSERHANLGISYTDRYRCLGDVTDSEKAIECHSRALALTPNGHPDMSRWYANLGVSYADRYARLGELENLHKAIECHAHALALTPEDHPGFPSLSLNHALSSLDRYNRTGHLASLTDSLHSFRKASQHVTGGPRQKFQCALRWANLASKQSLLNPIEAYQTAIDLLPQFIWLGATTNQRYEDLSLTDNLAVKACFAAIQSSNYSLALEWLEHARCVVWNQSLMLRLPLDHLHSSYPGLATRLKSISTQLHTYGFDAQPIHTATSGSMTHEEIGRQRRRLASEYHGLIAQTRQVPGFESFLQPVKANELIRAVRNRPVVVINCHADRCDALIILPGHEDVTHLPLHNFTEGKAQQARNELAGLLRRKGIRQRSFKVRSQPGFEDGIESVLRMLWSDVVKPVLHHLGYMNDVPKQSLPHITWCPTGPLSFLPLHAAGDYSQPQSQIYNYAVSSYIPTLSALLVSTPRAFNQDCRILAIGQANTPNLKPLPGTIKELSHVKTQTHNKAQYSQLTGDQATTAAVLDAMEQYDWVHLACHAHQNVNDPTQSGFFLHDGTLTLSTINQRSFKNKGLAFLSACQTATGDENLPDEAIHLASGMLMAGYPSVIATMWSVDDRDAPYVADKVYAQLMKDGKLGNGEAGRALHHAVAGLRAKVGEKDFGRWVPYIHIGS
ncbi:hypothetical protein ACGC1H_007391 [Rhizoctonia solani]